MRNSIPQVTEFIAQLEQPQQEIVQALRSVLLNAAPEMQERWVYNTPFYYLSKRLFYITVKPRHVLLGFCNGAQLQDPDQLLIGEQKVVRHSHITSAAKATQPELIALLHQAILLDELA